MNVLNEVYKSLGLLLGTEAPAVTPNGIDSPFCFINKQPHLAALLCCHKWKVHIGHWQGRTGQGRAGHSRAERDKTGQDGVRAERGRGGQGRAGQGRPGQAPPVQLDRLPAHA